MEGYIIFALVFLLLMMSNRTHSIYMLIILIAFSICREGVGWDYYSYMEVVELKIKGISHPDYYRFSFPWRYLIDFSAFLKYPKLIIILPSILTHLFIYLSLSKIFKESDQNIKFSLLVYAFFPFYYLATFSTIRQWLSVAIVFYAIIHLSNNRYYKYLFFMALGCVFHSSAVIGLIALFIKRLNWSLRTMVTFFVLSFVIALFINPIIDFLSKFGISSFYFQNPDTSGMKILLLLIGMAVYVLFAKSRTVEYQQSSRLYIDIFLWGVFFTVMTAPLGSVIGRIFYYFLITLIAVIPMTLKIYSDKSIGIVISLFSVVLFLAFFAYLFVVKDVVSYGAGYMPYQIGF